jgi:general secretion pathway protein L
MLGTTLDPARRTLVDFLRWWGRELAALVPARLYRLGWRPRETVLEYDGQGLRLLERRGATERVLDEPGGRRRGVLRLAASRVLVRRVALPEAALPDLDQVLGFEMNRLTPFKPEEVRFARRVTGRDPALRQIQVELRVVPRALVAAGLAEVARRGLAVRRIELGGQPPLEAAAEDGAAAAGGWQRRDLLLLALVVALAAAALLLPLERDGRRLAALEAQAEPARAEAEAAQELRQEISRLLEQRDVLATRHLTHPLVVEVLNEVTRLLPDHSHVEDLTLRGGELQLQGYSAAPGALIEILETSPLFAEVQFRAPVTRDPRLERDRFHLSARIQPRES